MLLIKVRMKPLGEKQDDMPIRCFCCGHELLKGETIYASTIDNAPLLACEACVTNVVEVES